MTGFLVVVDSSVESSSTKDRDSGFGMSRYCWVPCPLVNLLVKVGLVSKGFKLANANAELVLFDSTSSSCHGLFLVVFSDWPSFPARWVGSRSAANTESYPLCYEWNWWYS